MDSVILPPDLEQFATEAVASGRFRTVDEVVRTGMELLKQREQARAELLTSVLAAQEEGDRDGYLTGDDLLARVEARLAGRAASAL